MRAMDDDAALIARCRRGDGTAWEALVRRYQRLVFTMARRAGFDEHGAADVFQTVFARLLEALPRIQDPSRLQAWIVTTAKREALLQLGRSRRTVSLTPEDDSDDAPTFEQVDQSPLPDEVVADLQQLDRLRIGLERLDERCRQLLRLLFAPEGEAMKYDAIARTMGMEVGSIGPTRARCLGKLRQLVA